MGIFFQDFARNLFRSKNIFLIVQDVPLEIVLTKLMKTSKEQDELRSKVVVEHSPTIP